VTTDQQDGTDMHCKFLVSVTQSKYVTSFLAYLQSKIGSYSMFDILLYWNAKQHRKPKISFFSFIWADEVWSISHCNVSYSYYNAVSTWWYFLLVVHNILQVGSLQDGFGSWKSVSKTAINTAKLKNKYSQWIKICHLSQ